MGYLGFTTCVGKTKLSGGKSTYSARAKHRDTIKDKALVEGLAAETGYSATIVGAVVEGMRNYLCEQLKKGNKVDFGAFSVGLSVRGPFPAANAPFDPAVNSIGVDIPFGSYWLVIGCRDPKKSIVATGKRRVEVVPALR